MLTQRDTTISNHPMHPIPIPDALAQHLQAVDPVVIGMTRAKQHNIHRDRDIAIRKVWRFPQTDAPLL